MRIGTLLSGLILILTGVFLFLNNIGYGAWINYHKIGKFWPLLLIIIGLGFLGEGSIPRWLAYLIIILSVIAVGVYMILGNQTQLIGC